MTPLCLCLQVYYPVRHHLVQHMISAMQRLGFTPSVTIEQRKLAVDLAEVVIKWELQRIKDQQVRYQKKDGMTFVVYLHVTLTIDQLYFCSRNQTQIQVTSARARADLPL